jgi:hypothetical protein
METILSSVGGIVYGAELSVFGAKILILWSRFRCSTTVHKDARAMISSIFVDFFAWPTTRTSRNQKDYFSHRGHRGHRVKKNLLSVISVLSVAKNILPVFFSSVPFFRNKLDFRSLRISNVKFVDKKLEDYFSDLL